MILREHAMISFKIRKITKKIRIVCKGENGNCEWRPTIFCLFWHLLLHYMISRFPEAWNKQYLNLWSIKIIEYTIKINSDEYKHDIIKMTNIFISRRNIDINKNKFFWLKKHILCHANTLRIQLQRRWYYYRSYLAVPVSVKVLII